GWGGGGGGWAARAGAGWRSGGGGRRRGAAGTGGPVGAGGPAAGGGATTGADTRRAPAATAPARFIRCRCGATRRDIVAARMAGIVGCVSLARRDEALGAPLIVPGSRNSRLHCRGPPACELRAG